MMILHDIWKEKGVLFMCYRKAVSQIRFEIQQIDTLLESYKSLLAKCKEKEPDLIEITAIAESCILFTTE